MKRKASLNDTLKLLPSDFSDLLTSTLSTQIADAGLEHLRSRRGRPLHALKTRRRTGAHCRLDHAWKDSDVTITDITDAGLEFERTGQPLDLSYEVTGAGLEHPEKMTNVKDLNLYRIAIT